VASLDVAQMNVLIVIKKILIIPISIQNISNQNDLITRNKPTPIPSIK
jgi:hypothetical protein